MGWPRKVSGYITVWSAALPQLITFSSNITGRFLTFDKMTLKAVEHKTAVCSESVTSVSATVQ